MDRSGLVVKMGEMTLGEFAAILGPEDGEPLFCPPADMVSRARKLVKREEVELVEVPPANPGSRRS